MLKGKTIVLVVSGSIAAYKIPNLASMLVKLHADVHVLMTQNATNIINPIAFETLTGHKCLIDTFDRNFNYNIEHVALANLADVVLAAPATANIIAKMALGLADDMATTTLLACKCPKIVAPAMNTNMFENPILQDNLNILKKYGMTVIEPAVGQLACRTTGAGKMPECDELLDYILQTIACKKDLAGKKILVTAGATRESIDPVRYITNHSTGKMGYAIARAASLRGADVTLVSGASTQTPPRFVTYVPVVSARDMFEAVSACSEHQDIIIKAAAVADYTPLTTADEKIKKADGDMSIPLTRTTDIIGWLGEHRHPGQFLCGFSMETQNMLENSRAKLERKHIDMIAANNLKVAGAGFGTDTNVVTIITKHSEEELPLMSKEDVAHALLDAILKEMES